MSPKNRQHRAGRDRNAVRRRRGRRVIATVEFSEEPAAARRVPRIGDSSAIDMERVVALRPDVVVVWEGGSNAGQVAQLERLDMPLYRHRVERLADFAAVAASPRRAC